MSIKMNAVNFPNRGKGAKGFRSVMVPGNWTPMKSRKDDDGKPIEGSIERPELLPETMAEFKTATMFEVEALFKANNVQYTIQELALYGLIEKQTTNQDNSMRAQINVRALTAGYADEKNRENFIATVLSLIKTGDYTIDTAFPIVSTLVKAK